MDVVGKWINCGIFSQWNTIQMKIYTIENPQKNRLPAQKHINWLSVRKRV